MEPVSCLHCPTCHALYRSREWSHCPRDAAPLEPFEQDPWLGLVLGERYRLDALVGEGAMGRVYTASHTRIGRRFAVKVLFGDLAVQDSMRARFSREAETASRLQHPNLVSVVDFGETEGGQLFLVMEFLEGHGLDQILAKHGALPEDRVVRLGLDIALGLRHAHDRGLVHRDLKPENVVVVTDGGAEVPKVVDFGVAFVATEPDSRVTRAGMIVGTPAFMSPEQALGESVDHRADLYSLGMLLFHLLAGRGPFQGEPGEILRQVVTTRIPPIAEVRPEAKVSPELEAAVMRLLSKHPQDRFQDAEEVVGLFEQLKLDAGPTRRIPMNPAERDTDVVATPTEAMPRAVEPAESSERSFSPLWAAAAAALLMLAVTLGVVLVQRNASEGGAEAEAEVEVEAIRPGLGAEVRSEGEAAKEASEPAGAPADRASADEAAVGIDAGVRPEASGGRAGSADKRGSSPGASRRAGRGGRDRPAPPAEPEREAAASEPPPPAAEPKGSSPMTPAELTKRYTALGAQIEALARAEGDEVAAPFRDRYLRLPLSAALRSAALRETVAKALTALDADVAAASR